MNPFRQHVIVSSVMFIVAAAVIVTGGGVSKSNAATKAEIQAAIDRGKEYLMRQPKTGAAGSLASYSLVKAGVDKNHVEIQRCISEVLKKCSDSGYKPPSHHNYEAGVDAMLLEAVDKEAYLPQLGLIAKYLVERQRPYGGWFYPAEFNATDYGDTSISQYAVLGLWAAQRAGVEIPGETWDKAARWLMRTQQRDGGFTYHPQDTSIPGTIPTTGTTGTMTVAGTGSLLIVRFILTNDLDYDEGIRPPAATRRFGVLEKIPDEQEKKAKPKPRSAPAISASAIDRALKEGVRWTGEHFADDQSRVSHENYYFYGVERMAALLDVEKIGSHNWYEEGADFLLRKQAPEGSWTDSCGVVPATALTLLFLSKATATTIHKPPKRPPTVGGGLLVGGRGLPDNLDAVQMKAGEVAKRKQHGPVDGLLAELEKSSGAKVEAAQEAVVEAVQLEHPEQLIGQVDRLKKLSTDPRVEVRRTAMWALGRTGDVLVTPCLIKGLSDTDESVMREASAALCILSRRPNGCGIPIDPAEGLSDGTPAAVRSSHLEDWAKNSSRLWNEWYLKVRPYDERDDRTTLRRKQ